MYIDYVIRKYGVNSIVLCYAYPEEPSTKDSAHWRRSKGKVGRLVIFSGSIKLSAKKEIFLSNTLNKQNFLMMSVQEINKAHIKAITFRCRSTDCNNCYQCFQNKAYRGYW